MWLVTNRWGAFYVHNGRREVGAKDRSSKDAEDEVEFFDYHEPGNTECDACAIPPVICEVCEEGLVHTHFMEDLEATEGYCDYCALDIPTLSIV